VFDPSLAINNAGESWAKRQRNFLLAKANELTPDVVIMDIARPILGGLEAAKKMLETQPYVKIIVLSIQDDGPLVWCVLHAGEGGYVLKPEFSRNLAASVRSACSGLLV